MSRAFGFYRLRLLVAVVLVKMVHCRLRLDEMAVILLVIPEFTYSDYCFKERLMYRLAGCDNTAV